MSGNHQTVFYDSLRGRNSDDFHMCGPCQKWQHLNKSWLQFWSNPSSGNRQKVKADFFYHLPIILRSIQLICSYISLQEKTMNRHDDICFNSNTVNFKEWQRAILGCGVPRWNACSSLEHWIQSSGCRRIFLWCSLSQSHQFVCKMRWIWWNHDWRYITNKMKSTYAWRSVLTTATSMSLSSRRPLIASLHSGLTINVMGSFVVMTSSRRMTCRRKCVQHQADHSGSLALAGVWQTHLF